MCSTARFGVNTLDVDDAERVAWHDTSLVKRETILEFRLGLVHEALRDVMSVVDQTIGSVFNCLFLLSCKTLEVSDI